ncbi:M48 family metalloprotease [Pseudodesulfovibrio sp.]|nr:M48 family metalloprotease [Pseudodesulfovibrio sp.]
MRKWLTIFPALLAALLLVLSPAVTAHAQFGDKLTIRKENEMGREFDKIIRSQMPMVGDTYITDYVADLVNRVVEAKKPMPFRIQSAVVANPILNAFAIPGGYIYIFTGLIQEVNTESEIVGVIAHELAHVSQRHVASRLEKQQKIGLLSTAGLLAGIFLGVAGGSGSAKAGQALMMGSQGLATTAMLQYSQDDEREADHVGMNSLVKAGYNPKGMPGTFEVMLKNRWFDSGSQMPTYLSTHPGLSERITYLNDRIKRMPEVFLERKDDNTTFHKVQVLVRAKMSPASSALAYFTDKKTTDYSPMDYVGLGIVQEKLKDRDKAEASFDQALHMDGEDPLVAREAGIFYFKTGNHTKAYKYLQKAVIQNKRDALGLFYLARLQEEADDYIHAADNMRKVLKLVPEDWEVHHHLGMILGEAGDTFNGNLHLAYAALYSNNLRKAHFHAKQAQAEAKTDAQKSQLQAFEAIIQERAKLGK